MNLANLVYVNGEAAAKLGYVNAGTDRRIGGTIGRIAGRVQSEQSFKSATPPERELIKGRSAFIEIARAPNGRPHISVAVKRGTRWATVRFGWRFDPNWGDEGTLGHNPHPEIIGGYIFDGVIKLNAPSSFIEGVDDMAVSSTPLLTFDHAAVIHNDDGTVSIRWNLSQQRSDASSDRVFSLQPNGTIEDRPLEKPSPDYDGPVGIGPYEKGNIEDNRVVFRVGSARAVFAWEP